MYHNENGSTVPWNEGMDCSSNRNLKYKNSAAVQVYDQLRVSGYGLGCGRIPLPPCSG